MELLPKYEVEPKNPIFDLMKNWLFFEDSTPMAYDSMKNEVKQSAVKSFMLSGAKK